MRVSKRIQHLAFVVNNFHSPCAERQERQIINGTTEMLLGFASRYACLGDLDKWAASRLQVACK